MCPLIQLRAFRSFKRHSHGGAVRCHFASILALTCLLAVPGAVAQTENTATGVGTLANLTTGDFNTADGFQALHRDTTGSNNTATGHEALFSNTSGFYNTAEGFAALHGNTTGVSNTAAGSLALSRNTVGSGNTASGFSALAANVSGDANTASGFRALISNTTGISNTAVGSNALVANISGSSNVASGSNALSGNTSGILNAANGYNSLRSNSTGIGNTAIGSHALSNNSTGDNNIALGSDAGDNLTTGSNNIAIGAAGAAGEANTIRVGRLGVHTRAFVQGISGATVPNGVQVVVNPSGRLGTVVSSARYKEHIKPMRTASEALLALNPVTFQYKSEFDGAGIPQFGLIAEEVEKVHPDLVARDENGKVFTVRYDAVNAMLLNEFLKEHRRGEEQDRKLREQAAMIAQQQKQIEALAAEVHKVSVQVQLAAKPVARTAAKKR